MSEILNSSLRTAVKGTALVILGAALSMPLWFTIKILIVRSTTKEEFGIYSLALAVVGIVSFVATLGIPNGATRFISIFIGNGKKREAEEASTSALRIGLISGTTSFLLLFLLAGPAARHIFYMPEFVTPLKIISLLIPFSVMSRITIAVLRAHNIIRPKVYYLDIGQPIFFLVFLGVMLIIELPFTSILYGYLFSMIMVSVFISSYGYKKIGINPFPTTGGGRSAELLKFSIPLIVGNIANMLLLWTDTLMLGRYMPAEHVGIYNISISLARLLTFFLVALNFVFMPLAGEMHARRQRVELKRTYQILTKWIFSLALPLFFVLFLFPETTITFLFGERYIVASTSLRILALGFMFHVFLGANVMLLMVLGFSKTIMGILLVGAMLNVALNYILIKQVGLGINGAAVASLCSYVAINAAASLFLYRQSRIHPFTAKYLRPIAALSLVTLAIYVLAKSLPLYIWLMPLYLTLFVLCYVCSFLLTRSIEREDMALFEAVSQKTGFEMKPIRKILHRFVRE